MENDPRIEAEPTVFALPGFQEPFSAMSHLLGALIFVFLGYMLLRRGRQNPSGMIYLAVYAISVVLLLSLSGVYHMMVRDTTARRVLERLDHSAIFVLIAGTFTPALGILFRGLLRWGPLAIIWTAAVTGVTLKAIFFDELAEWLGLTLYLAMGWFGIFSGVLLGRRYGFKFVKPLLLGGIAYSVGALFEFLHWFTIIPGMVHPHDLFHVAVLIGAFWHWQFIWQFARGAP